MKKKRLIIIGAGGHGRVVGDIARLNGYSKIDFLDDFSSGKVIGKVANFVEYIEDAEFFVAIGNSSVRKAIHRKLKEQGARIVSLYHPNSVISSDAVLGEGCVVMAGAIINPNVVIGEGVIINTNSSVDHDCVVGDFSHISVGAKVCGTVNIGGCTWIGAGATVINNKNICDSCMVGAGATVVKDISSSGTYIGTPAKEKKTDA